ncbi:PRC-barrel domain-containing protein [Kordiimonas aestuarii]|uniref:PRC-barrel domain-containing protein n=1 Tax=Kordiimonas aestuarii TaxID=1005925 RepID=UPI0021D3BCD8|nr:PRC-barrel domain-containing protein [Kordiimonas aestuarii]
MACQAISVAQINHKQVVGISGEKLGIIEDVVMGQRDGAFSHVILRRGGMFGTPLGAHRYAFPFSAVTICADGSCCRIDITEHELEQLPQVDGKDYSGLHDPFKRRAMHDLLGGEFAPESVDLAGQR